MSISPTKSQTLARSTLERADELQRRFEAGIFPRTGGDVSHFRSLVRAGWLEYEDMGRDVDGIVQRDVPIYRLTEHGRGALEAMRAAERGEP